jgi:hypothetical protein
LADDLSLAPHAPANRIAALLDDLRKVERLRIGPREEIAVSRLLSELFARGAVSAPHELKPFLAPLLARTLDERERFDRAFDRAFAPPTLPPILRDILDALKRDHGIVIDEAELLARLDDPDWRAAPVDRDKLLALLLPRAGSAKPALRALIDERFKPPPKPPPPRRRRRLWPVLLAVCVALAIGLAFWLWSRPPTPAPAPRGGGAAQSTETAPDPIRDPDDFASGARQESIVATEAVELVMEAARPYDYAPTIEELSDTLAPRYGWGGEGYAERLAELARRPRATPLPLLTEPDLLARVAHATAIIDNAGDLPGMSKFEAEASRAIDALDETVAIIPYNIELFWEGLAADQPDTSDSPPLSIFDSMRQTVARGTATEPTDEQLLRGLSLWAQRHQRVVSLANAPWRRDEASTAPPPWTPFALAVIPLLLAAIWFAQALEWRKAHLRRRAPQGAASVRELVAASLEDVPRRALILSRAAQQLHAWTDRPSETLDIARTVEASVSCGQLTRVFTRQRAQPDYLVLIESTGRGDQETARLRALANELQKRLLHVSIYYFNGDPTYVHREHRERRAEMPFLTSPIGIEELAARTSDHRLVIISAGERFLDPVRGVPNRGAETLKQWPARAMLTPTPLSGWGAHEHAIARMLEMPIGRATEEGLLGLAGLLGLVSADTLFSVTDAPRARALPETFRVNRRAWTQDMPPEDLDWPELKQLLITCLDPAAYEWMSACAVYPEIRWDLTLYLGLSLDAPGSGKLYREDRLAQLTALPWFRVARMPDWLREKLIIEMGDRAEPIRELLRDLVQPKRSAPGEAEGEIRLPIASETAGETQRALHDAIFIDFLAKGRITDLDLRVRDPFRDRDKKRDIAVDSSVVAVGSIGVIFAAMAFALAPRDGQLNLFDGNAIVGASSPNGAWLPAFAAVLAAPLAMLIADSTPLTTLWRKRVSFGVFCLATSIAIVPFALQLYFSWQAAEVASSPVVSGALMIGLAAIALVSARTIAQRLGARLKRPHRRGLMIIDFIAETCGLTFVWGATVLYWTPAHTASSGATTVVAIAVAFALIGFLCIRFRERGDG